MNKLLATLTNGQKLSIAVVVLAVLGAILGITRWSNERDFRPLYTAVAAEDAGAVLQKLKESGTEYRVGDGGATILVSSSKVDEIRLQMAALGLPKSGRIGYELFDKTNFGVTDFTEQVNYHRALEGELERSVMALSEVEQARVHLSFPKASLFLETRQEAKASVMVKLRGNTKLSPQNVLAVTNLVASAVEGLKPEAVSLLDMQGNLLNRPRREGGPDGVDIPEASLDYRQRIEKDLLAKVNSTLEPVLGADKFRAGVSVECDFSGGEQSEETYDPNHSVMVSSQKTEDINGASVAGGVPGTASNLPRPTSRPGSTGGGMTRRTENITYQSSRLVKRTHLPQGNIKRMSVSVLVDHSVRWEGSGSKSRRIVEPPTAEKLKVIHDLVAGTIGLQAERGDQLVVQSLPFETSAVSEQQPYSVPSAGPSGQQSPNINLNLRQIWKQPIVLGSALAVLLIAVAALFLRGRRKKQTPAVVELPVSAPGLSSNDELRKQLEGRLTDQQALKEKQELEAMSALKLPAVKTQKTEVLTKHLTAETKKDPQVMAHILRTWLSER